QRAPGFSQARDAKEREAFSRACDAKEREAFSRACDAKEREALERFRLVHSTAVMVLLSAEVAMAAPYSMDLRERVANAWDESGDADEIAGTFQVSRAWCHRLLQRRRETGRIAPRKPTNFRSRVLGGP